MHILPWIQELTSMISNGLTAISAVVVAILGIIGLSQWRKELLGKEKLGIAKRLVSIVLDLEGGWMQARRIPMPYESPNPTGPREETADGPPPVSEVYAAHRQDLDALRPILMHLHNVAIEAKTLFGTNLGPYVQAIVDCINDLDSVTYEYYVRPKCAGGRWDMSSDHGKHCWELFYIIFPRSREEDRLHQRMRHAIDELMALVKSSL